LGNIDLRMAGIARNASAQVCRKTPERHEAIAA
jgi:hypothetical protein